MKTRRLLALAAAARARGADVVLVAANVALPAADGVRRLPVERAAELEAACRAEFPACDVLLMAAAVADFRPRAPAAGKLKKAGRAELVVTMEATTDVLSALAAERREGQVLVGFAAETGQGAVAQGREKLTRKGIDLVVVNDVARPGIGFDATHNEVVLVGPGEDEHVPRSAKADVAAAILERVERLRTPSGAEDRP